MLKHTTQQHNNWPLFLGGLLFIMAVLRFPVPPGQYRALFQFIAEITILVALAVLIIQKINLWAGLFLILATFSCVCPVFGKASLLARQAVVFGCIWYSIIVLMVNQSGIKYLLLAIRLIAIVHTLFLVLQFIGLDPYAIFSFCIFTSTITDYTGLMANRNEASMLLAFTIPAFFSRQWIFMLIPIVGLILARTTGPILAVCIGSVFYLRRSDFLHPHFKSALMAGICLVVPLYILFVDVPCIDERLKIWSQGLALMPQHLLIGAGIGHWKLAVKELHAHNDILQIIFEMGLLVSVIILGYLCNIYRRFSGQALLAATAGIIILITALISFPFYVAPTAIMAVTWMGILEISLRGNTNVRGSTRNT